MEKNQNALIASLIIISTIVNIGASYYFSSAQWTAFREMEYAKVGGKENYDLVNEAQRLQLLQQLPQIRQFVEQNKGAIPSTEPAVTSNKKLTTEEIAAIKKDAYIEGSPDAKITLVEYSDLECPFCIRQFKDGTIRQIHEKYGNKVNSIFKNFRGVPHENAEIEAVASLCAGQVGGTEKYAAYYQAILGRSTGENGRGFSKDALVPLAEEIGLDMKQFLECYESKSTLARFDAETAEGKKLGVSGTPGTIIINNETGAYELVAGAYPASEFERVIESLLVSE